LPSLPCAYVSSRRRPYNERTAYGLGFRLSIYQLLTEVVPIAILRRLLYDNLLVVIRQLVDDEFDLLVELQLIEFRHAVRGDRDSAFDVRSVCALVCESDSCEAAMGHRAFGILRL
jgi:hypothetical protein